jgi:uncharacterized membrane protein
MQSDTARVTSDREAALYRSVAWTLRAGLLLSIAVMAVGLALAEGRGSTETSRVLPLDRIVPRLLHGDPAAVLDTGIVLLFLSPLVAIVVAFAGFCWERDGRFVAISGGLILLALAGIAVAVR